MKIRLALWFLLMSGVIALGMGNNGVPPFFGSGSSVPFAGGIGDVVTGGGGTRYYYGLRALSIAKAGNNAINVCNAADATCVDMKTSTVTGKLIITSVGGTDCSGGTCTIKTIYDQAARGFCTGSCDMTQATISARPKLIPNCINGNPCARFVSASSQFLETAGTSPVVAQQISTSVVAKNTGTNTTIWGGNSNVAPLQIYNGPNQASIFAGTNATVTAADNTWHAWQSVFSGVNSAIQIDTTFTGSLNANTNALPAQRMFFGTDFYTSFSDGDIAEFGLWGVYSFTGGDLTALNANQKAFWKY